MLLYRQVSAVPEAAAGEYERQVLIAVGVGVAETAPVEHLGVVEQSATGFRRVGQHRQRIAERNDLRFFDLPQFGNLFRLVAVMH